jgi:hypothetical protein
MRDKSIVNGINILLGRSLEDLARQAHPQLLKYFFRLRCKGTLKIILVASLDQKGNMPLPQSRRVVSAETTIGAYGPGRRLSCSDSHPFADNGHFYSQSADRRFPKSFS